MVYIVQIYHDLDPVVNFIVVGCVGVVHDLCSTDPSQEARARWCRWYTAPTRRHDELDHTDHTYLESIFPEISVS